MNRLELIKTKFPEHYEDALIVEDPTGKKHKYLLWIANQLSKGHNSTDISQTLKFFNDNPDKFKIKDINKYKDLRDLENIVKEFGLSNRQAKEKDKEGAVKIYEDDNLMVIRIDDKPAMIIYGANTQWCTTMQDQSYYEDYVANGNDFYIAIRKNPTALASHKYAIVKKGLLDFRVYDDQDHQARSFSEKEEDIMRDVIKAIVSDNPPKNYLLSVVSSKVSALEAAEWLKKQNKITQDYVEGKRPELRFIYKTASELISIFKNSYTRRNLEKIEYQKLLDMAVLLKDMPDKCFLDLKLDVIKALKPPDNYLFAQDKDPKVRSKVIETSDSDKAKDFYQINHCLYLKLQHVKLMFNLLLNLLTTLNRLERKKPQTKLLLKEFLKKR
jgi:hypothetical protein